MRPQYAAQVDRSVVKSFQTPLRLQYALATMSSFAHFIHTNTAPIFSCSRVYVSGQSGKKSARPAESVTSAGKWRSPGRDSEQGSALERTPLMQRASDETNPSNCSAGDVDFTAWKACSISLYYTEVWQQLKHSIMLCSRVYYRGLGDHLRQGGLERMNFKRQYYQDNGGEKKHDFWCTKHHHWTTNDVYPWIFIHELYFLGDTSSANPKTWSWYVR